MIAVIHSHNLTPEHAFLAVGLHSLTAARTIPVKNANRFQAEHGWTADHSSREDRDAYAGGFASEGRPGQAYNEEAFGHFLTLERKRSERSGRPFLLLLVEFMEQQGSSVHVDPKLAGKLFDALWPSLRETDFIGWYRTGRVIGAVLTQPVSEPGAGISGVIHRRVGDALQEKLSADVSNRLQVRVYELPARPVNGR
jgi:hypothetical protein